MRPHVVATDTHLVHVTFDHFSIDGAGAEPTPSTRRFGRERPKQRPFLVLYMLRALQVFAHQLVGVGVDWHKTLFAALATDEHVAHAPALLAKVFHPQAAHLRAP